MRAVFGVNRRYLLCSEEMGGEVLPEQVGVTVESELSNMSEPEVKTPVTVRKSAMGKQACRGFMSVYRR